MRRTKDEAEKTKDDIFRAGLRVFSTKGYAAATLSDIAREAGVTRGAIYWHFRNKEEMYSDLLSRTENFYDGIVSAVRTSTSDFHASVRDAIITILRRLNSDEEWRAMQEVVLRTNLLHRPGKTKFLDELRENKPGVVLQDAIEAGRVSRDWDRDTALTAIVAYVGGLIMEVIRNDLKLTEKQMENLADFAVRGLKK